MTLITKSFTLIPDERFDDIPWAFVRIEETAPETPAGPFTEIDVLAIPIDPTPADPDKFSVTTHMATLDVGLYRFRFDVAPSNPSPYTAVVLNPDPAVDAFATVADIAARLGRDLTAGEATQTPVLLELATGLIAEATGKDGDWPATVSPVPPAIRSVCVEAVVRVLQNPLGVRSQQEGLGVYSHQENFLDAMAGLGLSLTDAEVMRVRRAVFGKLVGSSKPKSIASHLFRDITGGVVVDDLDTTNQ